MDENKARGSVANNNNELELVITRIFDAPRELVWKAWTDPERVKQWWGPSIDKSADAAIESFGKMWQSMLLQSEGQKEFASRLQKIYSEANRK